MSKPSLFIVDDHPIVRMSLKDIFSTNDYTIVGEAGDIASAEKQIMRLKPDVSIVDINMGEQSGLLLIERLIEDDPDRRIMVYSTRDNIQTISAAYQAGAKGYLSKSGNPMLLLKAVERIHQGSNWFMPGIPQKLAEFRSEHGKDPSQLLTDKEFEIFLQIAAGKSPEEAAVELGVSHGSILNRLVQIRKKTGCKTYSCMSLLAIEYGYITMSD